ncbi:MAG: IS630 family transposase [Methylocystis silviterrae]
MKRYVVRLSGEERAHLEAMLRKGKHAAKTLLKARILLEADVSEAGDGLSDGAIIAQLDTNASMVCRVRKQLVEEGFAAVLSRKPHVRPSVPRIFDGEKEAKLIALSCSAPPKGYARWTLRLLEKKVVELDIVEAASDSTIGRVLKKHFLKPHRKQQWVIPPQADAGFVAAMEEVLEVYQRPHDPLLPVVCIDETTKQLLKETRQPIAMQKGRPQRVDYEYERNGTASIFMIFAPLEGRREALVTQRHTAIDYANALKHVADEMFPQAEKIVLVQDNLNTHKPASLYQAFEAKEARRLTERFEWHYTPKHGSWIDLAESELSVLSSQCLDRRIGEIESLRDEVAAWVEDRNKNQAKADWQFTTDDARVKLKALYPIFPSQNG